MKKFFQNDSEAEVIKNCDYLLVRWFNLLARVLVINWIWEYFN
jgi:hypothetical protein